MKARLIGLMADFLPGHAAIMKTVDEDNCSLIAMLWKNHFFYVQHSPLCKDI